MEKIKLNSVDYINSSELAQKIPKGTNFSKGSHFIIKQLKLLKNVDYTYGKKINNKWVQSDGKSRRIDKVLIKMSSLEKSTYLTKIINEINGGLNGKEDINDCQKTNVTDDIVKDSIECLPILRLTEEEKFKDSNNNLYDIEVRGYRKYDKVYIKVKDIGKCFKLERLRKTVTGDKNRYEKNIDYVYMKTENNIVLFFTYRGLLRSIYSSHSKETGKFVEWSTKILFTAQLGTEKQKNKLVSSIKGISYDIIHELFSKNARSMPCTYLVSLNTVKELRKVMNINDKYSDDDLVYKFGLTKSFETRTYNHKSEYKEISDNIDLNLVLYTYIDPLYLHEAETMISEYTSDMKLNYKNHKELVVISKSNFKNVKMLFEQIGNKYSGHTSEFNKQIGDLKNIINDLQLKLEHKDTYINSIIDKHKLELANKDLIIANKELLIEKNKELYETTIKKNDELYKAKIEALQYQLKYQELHSQYRKNN